LKLLQPSDGDNKTPPSVPWLDGLIDAASTGIHCGACSVFGVFLVHTVYRMEVNVLSLQLFHLILDIYFNPFLPYIGPGGEYETPTTDDDIEQVATNTKHFKPVLEAHQQVSDMMNEECSHLLRKAQAAVSKAAL